jgi:hypothetical protein
VAELRQSMEWVDQVYPSNRDGGAWVSMTWDEFEQMHLLIRGRPMRCKDKSVTTARGDINLKLRNATHAAEARANTAETDFANACDVGRRQEARAQATLRALNERIQSALANQEQDVKVNGARHPGLLEPMRDILRSMAAMSAAALNQPGAE